MRAFAAAVDGCAGRVRTLGLNRGNVHGARFPWRAVLENGDDG